MAYAKSENYAMAKKELEDALKISPNFTHADEIKRLLEQSPQKN